MIEEKRLALSIVIPVYNESENLADLITSTSAAMQGFGDSYEILLVDDGSTDDSWAIMKSIARQDSHIRLIRFGINYGQTAALSAGFHHAKGEIIVTMDADFPKDSSGIPRLIDKIKDGYDVVSGWRKERHDAWLTRRLPSMAANRVISYITGLKLRDYGCTLKA